MRVIDARTLNQVQFAAALELQQWLDRTRDPEIMVTPAAELRATFADNDSENASHERLVAFDHAHAVAIGHLELTRDPANAALALVEINPVSSDAATLVLQELLQLAQAAERTLIIAWGDYTSTANAFWTRLGAKLRYNEQESDLNIAAVDTKLMEQWIAAAPAEINLVHWQGRCPDTHINALLATANAMNDAPTEGLSIADTLYTEAMLWADFAARDTCGFDYLGILAVDTNGSAAGATEVLVNRYRPTFSWQWNTVVLPAYRGRGIGRWLKATMWKRLRTEFPKVEMLRTGNAQSNNTMLTINQEMGFQPSHSMAFWQANLTTLLGRLNQS